MNIPLILFIVGIILVFFLTLKIFKKIIKAAIAVIILILVVTAVTSIVVYNDAMIIRKGFEDGKIIAITKNDELITAFNSKTDLTLTATIRQEFYETINPEKQEEIEKNIKENELDKINNETFIMVLNHEIFLEEKTKILGKETNTTQSMLDAFATTKEKEDAILILTGLEGITEEDTKELQELELHEIKSQIYYELFLNKFKETRGTFLINEIKENNIKTNPQLLSITVLNVFPENIMKRLAKDE